MSKHLILLGTHGRSWIEAYLYDEETQTITKQSETKLSNCKNAPPHGTSWLLPHPTHHDLVYTYNHGNQHLLVLRVTDSLGNVDIIDIAETGGVWPNHLTMLPDQSAVIVSNYISGTCNLIEIGEDGMLLSKKAKPHHIIALKDDRNHPFRHFRQDKAHCHQVYMFGEQDIVIPDLGSNKVWWTKIAKDKSSWEIVGEILGFEESDGPRHCAVHPSGSHLYVLSELSNTLTVHTLPMEDLSKSTVVKRFSILPPEDENDKAKEVMTAAEICLLPPTIPNGPMLLLCSNRDTPRPGGDSIALFSVSSSDGGQVERAPQGWAHHVGLHLRCMQPDPDNKLVVAAGREGGQLVVLRRGGAEGLNLNEVARLEGTDWLVCAAWLRPEWFDKS